MSYCYMRALPFRHQSAHRTRERELNTTAYDMSVLRSIDATSIWSRNIRATSFTSMPRTDRLFMRSNIQPVHAATTIATRESIHSGVSGVACKHRHHSHTFLDPNARCWGVYEDGRYDNQVVLHRQSDALLQRHAKRPIARLFRQTHPHDTRLSDCVRLNTLRWQSCCCHGECGCRRHCGRHRGFHQMNNRRLLLVRLARSFTSAAGVYESTQQCMNAASLSVPSNTATHRERERGSQSALGANLCS